MVRTQKDIELGLNEWVILCDAVWGCMIFNEILMKDFLSTQGDGYILVRVYIAWEKWHDGHKVKEHNGMECSMGKVTPSNGMIWK